MGESSARQGSDSLPTTLGGTCLSSRGVFQSFSDVLGTSSLQVTVHRAPLWAPPDGISPTRHPLSEGIPPEPRIPLHVNSGIPAAGDGTGRRAMGGNVCLKRWTASPERCPPPPGALSRSQSPQRAENHGHRRYRCKTRIPRAAGAVSASLGGDGDSDNGPCVSATLQTHTWSGLSC